MIKRIVTPGMGANCYLVSCDKTNQAFLVDPGAGSKMILNSVKENKMDISLIILTHGHFDHIGAVEFLRKELNAKVAIHKNDAEMLLNPEKNLSRFIGMDISLSPAEIMLEDNEKIMVGELEVKVLHTPGHTPGSICLLTEQGLFSGDTLFAGSIGRTDFPGGNMTQLLQSIEKKLLDLNDDTKVFPGHETITTIGRERKTNPFINGAV